MKKLEAQVVAVVAATAAPVAAPQKKSLAEEDDITGKIPPKVINIILRFTGLP